MRELAGLFDNPDAAVNGPLWIRWLTSNTSAFQDFNEFIDSAVCSVRSQYREADAKTRDILASREDFLVQLQQQVKMYVEATIQQSELVRAKERRQHAFRQAQ